MVPVAFPAPHLVVSSHLLKPCSWAGQSASHFLKRPLPSKPTGSQPRMLFRARRIEFLVPGGRLSCIILSVRPIRACAPTQQHSLAGRPGQSTCLFGRSGLREPIQFLSPRSQWLLKENIPYPPSLLALALGEGSWQPWKEAREGGRAGTKRGVIC